MTGKKKSLKKGGVMYPLRQANFTPKGLFTLKEIFSNNNIKKYFKPFHLSKEDLKRYVPGTKETSELYNSVLQKASNLAKAAQKGFEDHTNLVDAAAIGTTAGIIGGITGDITGKIIELNQKIKSVLSKEEKKSPVESTVGLPVKSTLLDKIKSLKNIDVNNLDAKTAKLIGSLIGAAAVGTILYKKLTKQKITKEELEIEKLVKSEQSTPSKSPKKKSLINKIIQYGAIPLAGVMAVSQLKTTLKK